MLGNVHRIVPKTQNLLKLSALSLAIMSLVGCDEDFKDCQGFWDNATGRSECNVTANSQLAQQALSADFKKAFGADPNKEDTDGDGLSDTFEIIKGYPYLKPDNKDTDGNGVEDAKDDIDKDGLTNLEEMQANTDPTNPDTDGDGLNDKSELQTQKTNPLVADTDKDTISDGREVANGSDPLIADADKFVTSSDTHTLFSEDGTTQKLTVAIAGKGDLSSKVEVKGWSDFKTPFQVGESYDITLNDADKAKMQDATITLPYDPNDPAAANPSDLKIYTISPTTGFYEELPTTVDTVNHTITAKTTHFSPYLIGNSSSYVSYTKNLPQTCPLITDPNAIPVDVALVIDSSGSMRDNDPQNLRITAAKSFITNMKVSDRAAVIDFDSGVIVHQNLTSEKTALSNALNLIDAAGGTNIGAGVGSAYSVLTSQSDDSHTRVVILLTDGVGSYDTNLSNQLKAQNIRVFTIGLTGQVDEALLKAISSVTNGGYKQINDASGLVGVFGQFATVFGDTGADTDKDGLTDCQEIQGITALNYNNYRKPPALATFEPTLIFTKPDNPDSDGDGIPDGVEVGAITSSIVFNGTKLINTFKANILSNPSNDDLMIYSGNDSDGDGLTDVEEYEIGSNPIKSDGDKDGVSDAIEVENDTDPTNPNSFPVEKRPITRDQAYWDLAKKGAKAFARSQVALAKGAFCGDVLCDLNTAPEIIGAVIGGFIPLIDIRDVAGGLVKKEYDEVVLAGLGLIPVYGDSVKGAAVVTKALVKHPEIYDETLEGLEALGDEGAEIAAIVRRDKNPILKGLDISGETIVRLEKGGTNLAQLSKAIEGSANKTPISLSKNAGAIPADRLDNGFLKFWRDGELHVNDGVPKEQRYNKGLHAGVTGDAKTDLRFPDSFNQQERIAKEAKVGCESSERIITQIDKDVALRATKQYEEITWHFFPSAKSNCVGPSKKVMEHLLAKKIPYYVYLP